MPIPAFTRQTALFPDETEQPFAMIGRELLPYLKEIGARNWIVYTALLLRSDSCGLTAATLPDLATDTGLNRETVQTALDALNRLIIGGRRVMRKVPSLKFGRNRYVLFPDRPDAPLSNFPDAPEKVRKPKAAPLEEPPALVFPTGWADDEEEPEQEPEPPVSSGKTPLLTEDPKPTFSDPLPFVSSGKTPLLSTPVSSGKTPLLNQSQVAEKPRYYSIYEKKEGIGETNILENKALNPSDSKTENTTETDESLCTCFVSERLWNTDLPHAPYCPVRNGAKVVADKVPDPPQTPSSGQKKGKRQPPVRNPDNPVNAADLTALYVDLFTTRYSQKPVMNFAAFGQRMKAAIIANGVESAAGTIRFYFAANHRHSRRFSDKGHAANFLVLTWQEVAALSTGKDSEARAFQQTAADKRVQRETERLRAANGGEIIAPHLRALWEEDEEPVTVSDPYAHLYVTVPQDENEIVNKTS